MPQPICNLATKNCKPCTEGLAALDQNEIDRLLQTLNGWEQRGHELVKTYPFKNYYETMAFVKRNGLDFAPRGPPPGSRSRLSAMPRSLFNTRNRWPF